MPLFGDDSQVGGDGPFDALSMIGAAIALFSIGVMMALVVVGGRNAAHAGDTPDSEGTRGGSGGGDTARSGDLAEDSQDEIASAEGDGHEVCANCGKEPGDAVELKNCAACLLVKYCSVDCQKAHRKQHKKACKQRAAELKDEQLYSQGHERPEEDFCSICALPIPLPSELHSLFGFCCFKKMCRGCEVAIKKRGMNDCPFCRTPHPTSQAECLAMMRARAEKKDPAAINLLGEKTRCGKLGLQMDFQKAVELWTEAAELGSAKARYNLGVARTMSGDREGSIRFWTEAAMQGHVESRHNLGEFEWEKRNYDRAVKHFLISAKMGFYFSVDAIKTMYTNGLATKEQYAAALSGFQDAVKGMESRERDEAKRLGYTFSESAPSGR